MNIIVTGASSGIGFELVKILSKNQSNKILAIARNEKKLINLRNECKGGNVVVLDWDITDYDSVNRLIVKLDDEFEQVDILINNAGLLVNKKFEELTPKDVAQTMEVNFGAVVHLIQHVLPKLKESARGHIVNIGSMGGFQGSAKFPGLSAYSSSKAALACLSEVLALEFTEYNIAVNCLALGAAQTEMLDQAFPGYKAPVSAHQMAEFIADFALKGAKYINGKTIPVAMGNP